ncbi:O-antigen ligase family protein [Thermodesulfobacteriota bacterium]
MYTKGLTYLYWVILLYKPDWMLSHYFSFFGFLPRINIFILIITFLSTFFIDSSKKEFKFLLPFLIICLFSLFFARNTGIGRPFLKLLFQYYMLGVITLTYFDKFQDMKSLMICFLFHFSYYCIWGIFNGGITPWHIRLNETNAFGPYIILGISFSFFYSFGTRKLYEKITCYINIFLGLLNVALTFTMGSFLTLIFTGLYILIRFPRKMKAISILAALVGIYVLCVNLFLPESSSYWQEMARMKTDFGKSSAGGERLFLWRIAFREFIDHPFFGVGLNNFGILAPEYTTDLEVQSAQVSWSHRGNLWGFSLHNSHLVVLTELGLFGIFFYLFLFVDFFKKNRFIKNILPMNGGPSLALNTLKNQHSEFPDMVLAYAIAMALEGGLMVYIISGTFYGLLFYPDFWMILICNRLLFSSLNFYVFDSQFKKQHYGMSANPSN